MKIKSAKLSLWAVIVLLVASLVVLVTLNQQTKISANTQNDQIIPHSIPFKVGDNTIVLPRSLDLSQRIIGLNGSLITLEDAKQRGIIEGAFDENGNELDSSHLLSSGASFIIKVKDISSTPALFF